MLAPTMMTVTGNVVLASGSTTLLQLNAAAPPQLAVSGAVTVGAGATLQIAGSPAPAPGTFIPLIVAQGGLSGAFTAVETPAGLAGFVVQRGNAVDLFGLSVTSQGYDADFIDGQITLSRAAMFIAPVRPWFEVGVRYELDGVDRLATASLPGGTADFTAFGADRSRLMGTAGAGATWTLGHGVAVYAAYRTEFGGDGVSHNVGGGLTMGF